MAARQYRPGLPTVSCPACKSRFWAAEPVEAGGYELKCEICCRCWADWAPGDPDWMPRQQRVATAAEYLQVRRVANAYTAVTETETGRKLRRAWLYTLLMTPAGRALLHAVLCQSEAT